mmetsp:Transcript_82360/g.255664  ORF Transcript_82360/g.255664 Transcript_82360/m.255664 type:complete len:327 (-) Transcript_82360:31-1011(-)
MPLARRRPASRSTNSGFKWHLRRSRRRPAPTMQQQCSRRLCIQGRRKSCFNRAAGGTSLKLTSRNLMASWVPWRATCASGGIASRILLTASPPPPLPPFHRGLLLAVRRSWRSRQGRRNRGCRRSRRSRQSRLTPRRLAPGRSWQCRPLRMTASRRIRTSNQRATWGHSCNERGGALSGAGRLRRRAPQVPRWPLQQLLASRRLRLLQARSRLPPRSRRVLRCPREAATRAHKGARPLRTRDLRATRPPACASGAEAPARAHRRAARRPRRCLAGHRACLADRHRICHGILPPACPGPGRAPHRCGALQARSSWRRRGCRRRTARG